MRININKVLSGAAWVDSVVLNILGLQAFRAALAALFKRIRYVIRQAETEEGKTLRTEGIVVIKDILPKELYSRVKMEFNNTMNTSGNLTQIAHSNTYGVEQALSQCIDSLPATREFLHFKKVNELLNAGEGRESRVESGCYEILVAANSNEELPQDANKKMHSDIYYCTHKAWLLLEDVNLENGPFVYVKRSHKFSLKRLLFEYHAGVMSSMQKRTVNFTDDNIFSRFCKLEETPIVAPENSLIVANTCGFHKRGAGSIGVPRKAIRLSQRFHPYKLDHSWWN